MNEKIRVPAAVSEINLDQVLRGQPRSYRYQGVSKYPFVERDFALVMDRQTPVGDVLREMKIQSGGMLVASQVFDIYEGDQIAAHQKSVAVRLRFQDKNATLQEEAITELQQKILSAIGKKFSAVIR
jgi:phenylalanyl-tRNA synthetase beta chain